MEKDWKKRLPLSFKNMLLKQDVNKKECYVFVFDETRNTTECQERLKLFFNWESNTRSSG